MAKKHRYVPYSWEHDKRIGKPQFFSVYKSMMDSIAWKELTNRQMVLYLYMKTQVKPNDSRGEFSFNQGIYKNSLNLYTNTTSFCKDKDALIEKGFIDCLDGGSVTKTKAVYRMSDRWVKYGTEQYECPTSVMSDSMVKKLNRQKAI